MIDPDLALLDRWCAGDTVAGNELFKRHFSTLYGFFEHKTAGEVDDLVQETLMRCVSSRDTFERRSTFRTYMFAVARRVLLEDWRRRATARPTLDFEEVSIESLSTTLGTRLANRADRAHVLEVLRTLPLDQQVLLELFYWEDCDREALAEVYGVEPATIGSRLFRARHAMHERLKASGRILLDDELDAWARSRDERAPR